VVRKACSGKSPLRTRTPHPAGLHFDAPRVRTNVPGSLFCYGLLFVEAHVLTFILCPLVPLRLFVAYRHILTAQRGPWTERCGFGSRLLCLSPHCQSRYTRARFYCTLPASSSQVALGHRTSRWCAETTYWGAPRCVLQAHAVSADYPRPRWRERRR